MFSGIFAQSIILFVNGKRIYEALQDCRPDRKKLMMLYLEQLQEKAPPTEHILVAIDHTAWGRPDAKTLKDRTHEYQRGASQLKLVCEHSVNPVLAVLDREYGNASWVLALTQASIQADCLMRVRKNA
ncbi:MAG: hypothetical protein JGK12_14775 [Microcoleus sp. PH2017_01_SCD_O_A]|uniref:hypothetical protein n=1 Tax=Microcoleus sp. PH2017_01_SCD_O_A TaxID=2798812 RepID=UPI001E0D42B9|nr:hypothetical protein [Microcoleus sp. PH2017_01_SCD_O_A]MCC3425157.1 hypothetical protein [Microcoleus sp. PH2017_01_SCD_O_A]